MTELRTSFGEDAEVAAIVDRAQETDQESSQRPASGENLVTPGNSEKQSVDSQVGNTGGYCSHSH